jgi:hypothetical protein
MESLAKEEKPKPVNEIASLSLILIVSRSCPRYVSVFLDAKTHRLLFVSVGRTSLAVEEFAQALIAHRGDPKRIESSG